MTNFENSIHDIGHRAAMCKHIELVITSSLSQWIDVMPEAAAVSLAGAHAHVHADHAQLWDSRIPLLWDQEASHWNTESLSDLVSVVSQIGEDKALANTTRCITVYCRRCCRPTVPISPPSTLEWILRRRTSCKRVSITPAITLTKRTT